MRRTKTFFIGEGGRVHHPALYEVPCRNVGKGDSRKHFRTSFILYFSQNYQFSISFFIFLSQNLLMLPCKLPFALQNQQLGSGLTIGGTLPLYTPLNFAPEKICAHVFKILWEGRNGVPWENLLFAPM